MKDVVTVDLKLELTSRLTHFKEYAVSHPQLLQVDKVLMQAIQEPAGFAHVLIYGPSGVGKTTMIRQLRHLSKLSLNLLRRRKEGVKRLSLSQIQFERL